MVIDNFSLEQFTCPAKYYLRIRQHLVPVRVRPALSFGGVIHAGLAAWYSTGSEAKALQAIHESWPQSGPSDDFRTEAYALRVMHEYIREYPEESWKVLQGASGPIVEQTFTLDTGMFLDCQQCGAVAGDTADCKRCGMALEPILYGGIIDVGAEFGDMLYVVDHKTTTRLGDGTYFFLQFKPDNQLTGYIWALSRLTNRQVGGAIVNAIGLYKTHEVRFRRSITSRSEFEIKEWLIGVKARCDEIKRCERTGVWRLETSQCLKYGECEYRQIHILSDEHSRAARMEQDYVKSEWVYEQRDD